jgi:hypothetical protein
MATDGCGAVPPIGAPVGIVCASVVAKPASSMNAIAGIRLRVSAISPTYYDAVLRLTQ